MTTTFGESQAEVRYKAFLKRLITLTEMHHGAITFREIVTNLRLLSRNNNAPLNTTNKPLRILNVHANGDISTFAPELVAAKSEIYHDIIMGNILQDSLADLLQHPVYQKVHEEIEAGIGLCKETCAYWRYCGGGSPANKFFEHGRFHVSVRRRPTAVSRRSICVAADRLDLSDDPPTLACNASCWPYHAY